MQRRRVFYSGRVQGVGFRFTARHVAGGFAVTGWVRNLPDGRVELLAEGAPAEIDAFLARLGEEMRGNIVGVDQLTEHATSEFSSFEVTR
jgi:acylphosphatase